MKKIAILGSTGSIGTQTLSVIEEHADDFEVTALACGNNIRLLEEQMRKFRPKLVAVWSKEAAASLRVRTADLGIPVETGMDGLLAVATYEESEILVTAIVGMLGIRPTIAAIKAKKTIALANKETLVTAGHLIIPLAAEYGVSILPVDSEHSAIFQSLQGNEENPISKILLTASGGPFRGRKKQDLLHIQAEDALKHPNWSMGHKVTIDSSTLVNKGLEVMEAKWLFGVELEQIEVVVHPQSVIHSAVEYEDGAVIAQLGTPDMRLPIQYALYYPKRKHLSGKRLDLFALRDLTFERPDTDTFRGLSLAYDAARRGGNIPTVFNAANEKAVAMFLDRKIAYPEITEMQTRAILGAALDLKKEGIEAKPEIMVPLTGILYEFKEQEKVIRTAAEELFKEVGDRIEFKVGTMIEIPRAALTADRIASSAEFFSFGTNDLTQMTFGYSRDDIASFLPVYLEKKILKVDPFQVLDQNGVGQLVRMATEKGRAIRPDLKCGICGEHGGEPSSVKFCHKVGLNYVSCSPFRVPIARIAAAQAALED